MKKIFLLITLLLLVSCGGGKLSELNNNLEKLEEFNKKYADVEEYERDQEDEYRDQDLQDNFRFACAGDDETKPYYEKEYTLMDDNGNIQFPEDLAGDTTLLTNDCVQAGEIYLTYLEGDYIKNNISTADQKTCINEKITETRGYLAEFKSDNSGLSARYASLPLKFVAAGDIGKILETRAEDYKAINELWLDYGSHKINMITNSTLHLLTKDKCIEKGIEKDVLESLDKSINEAK